jgi:hypothetical protein
MVGCVEVSVHFLEVDDVGSKKTSFCLVREDSSMAIPSALTNRPLASLKLPRAHIAQLIGYARAIVDAMGKSASFKSPTPSLKVVSAAIEALQAAQTTALTRASGAATTRNDRKADLVKLLQALKAYVQTVADATPENAVSIIESAGMSVRRHPVFPGRVFAAKHGDVSGTVKLVAPSAGARAGYEWAHSTDAGKTWVSAPFTLTAKTTMSGFTPGATVMFRYRATTRAGEGDWSQVVSIIVM